MWLNSWFIRSWGYLKTFIIGFDNRVTLVPKICSFKTIQVANEAKKHIMTITYSG